MNVVEPIRDKAVIQAIAAELRKNNYRDYMLFTIGCNTSLRVSDLLGLTAGQVRGKHLDIKAQKTKKRAVVALGNISDLIDDYTKDMAPDEYLFKSQKAPKIREDGLYYELRETRRKNASGKVVIKKTLVPARHQPDSTGHVPIDRIRAWKILNNAAKKVGIDYSFGTHSMRKTFAYWYYMQTQDIATLMRILGHATERQTLEYIGINQDVVDDKMAKFVIDTGKYNTFDIRAK